MNPPERRAKPRTAESLPVTVWGVDSSGDPFSLDCFVDNISDGGLYLQMSREMNAYASISLVVQVEGPRGKATAALKGRVLRNERKDDGCYGVAVGISELRFV
jgi:PilZ domain